MLLLLQLIVDTRDLPHTLLATDPILHLLPPILSDLILPLLQHTLHLSGLTLHLSGLTLFLLHPTLPSHPLILHPPTLPPPPPTLHRPTTVPPPWFATITEL